MKAKTWRDLCIALSALLLIWGLLSLTGWLPFYGLRLGFPIAYIALLTAQVGSVVLEMSFIFAALAFAIYIRSYSNAGTTKISTQAGSISLSGKYCRYCRAEYAPDAVFCWKCGRRID